MTLKFSNFICIHRKIWKIRISDKMPRITELVEIVDHAFLVTLVCTISALILSSSAKPPECKLREDNSNTLIQM